MSSDKTNVYAIDEGKNNCLTMTKEQILTAIIQAVNEGTIGDIDAGFITKIQEMNAQEVVKLWFGTVAEFQALKTKDTNTLYMFTDDPTVEDIEQSITDLEAEINDTNTEISKIKSGSTTVGKSENVETLYLHKIAISNTDQEASIYISITSGRPSIYTLTEFKGMLGNNKKIQATGAINYGQSSGIPLRALVYSIYQSSGSLYVEGFQENLTITVPIQDTISFTDTVITLN